MINPISEYRPNTIDNNAINNNSQDKKKTKNLKKTRKILDNDINKNIFVKESQQQKELKPANNSQKKTSYWDYYDVLYLGI